MMIIIIGMAGAAFLWAMAGYLGFKWAKRWYYRNYRYSGTEKREPDYTYYTLIGPLANLQVKAYIDANSLFDIRNFEKGLYFLNEAEAQKRKIEIEELCLFGKK